MKILKSILVIMLLLVSGHSLAYEKSSLNILVNGKSRNMVVFTPDNVSEDMPLMIVTHGMNQSPEYQYDADKLYQMVDSEKFIVVYLRSNGNTWDIGGTSDQKFVEQTIGEMYALYKIDAHRVYWSGFSMGSMLIYHSMHNMTGKIAAFAPCSGIQFSEQPWNKVKGPINLIHCHAKDDSVFPLDSYDVHSYVENMSKVNGENTYTKTTNYRPMSGATPGEKEVWENADGYKVELFMYNWGDHNPSHNNAVELWNFCKNYRLETIDPIPEPEQPKEYTVVGEDEITGKANRLSGQLLFCTNNGCTAILYGNTSLDSPQNIRSGNFDDLTNNEYYMFKLKKVTDAQTTLTGNFYTIQMANQEGGTYDLWENNGYLNTPPGSWCLFALGLNNQYGQDAQNYGLWKVDYEDGKGYTIQNVGAAEAGENSWLSPAFETPQADKQYVRLYKKLTEKTAGIETVSATSDKSSAIYDLTGMRVTTPKPGRIYIRNGKKFIMR